MRENCFEIKSDQLLLFVRLPPNGAKDRVLGLLDGIKDTRKNKRFG